MSEVNLFEKASRLKLKFKTNVGVVNVEDLWDLPLTSLNMVAKSLNKEIKEASEESFIKVKTKATDTLELGFNVVIHVINTLLAENEARKTLASKRLKRQQLLERISQKEDEVLSNKSLEELKAELEAIDAE